MRMRRCGPSDERGATAVFVAIVLIAILGMLSMAVDGGFIYLKFRGMRNANDAAALAAALSCALHDGQGAADGQANLLATSNVNDAASLVAPQYNPNCDAPAGTVTVNYKGQQKLFFSQVVGVTSPKTVAATATATWGGSGEMTSVVPLMLSMNRLLSCDIPLDANLYPPPEGTDCFFWWDNGSAQDTTALNNAEWGLMDLRTWGVEWDGSCAGNVNQNEVGQWITLGYPGTLTLKDPPPTYVCRGSGFQGNALNNDINSIAGQTVPFPVNDPSRQLDSSGALCPPESGCTVQKYAIVGYAMLEIVWVWTGNDAQVQCNQPAASNGSLRCLKAIWVGYFDKGSLPGRGQNFGTVSVTLSG